MSASVHVEALKRGEPGPAPPYVPLLGKIVPALSGVGPESLAVDAQAQTRALVEVGTALGADVLTVGLLGDPEVGAEVVRQIEPLLNGRGVAACIGAPEPAPVRAYCEAGAEMLFLVDPDLSDPRPLRTVANVAAFYKVPVILATGMEDGAGRAEKLGLQGAVVPDPTGEEPGIVGGGLDPALPDEEPRAPRAAGFFWSFPTEVPSDAVAEDLAQLGRRLHP